MGAGLKQSVHNILMTPLSTAQGPHHPLNVIVALHQEKALVPGAPAWAAHRGPGETVVWIRWEPFGIP